MRFRFGLVVAAMLVLTALSSCTPRPQGIFENNTSQILLVKARNPEYPTSYTLLAHQRRELPIVAAGECTSDWLVYDQSGSTLVKDPGPICAGRPVSIP